MATRISRLLFSNLSTHLSNSPKASIFNLPGSSRLLPPSPPTTHFTTIPDQPTTTDHRTDAPSGDPLLHSSDNPAGDPLLHSSDKISKPTKTLTQNHPTRFTETPSSSEPNQSRSHIQEKNDSSIEQSRDTIFKAPEIFEKMKKTGLVPNAVAMVDGLCKDGLTREAMKLFGLMHEKGTIPEVVIYTAVVEGFCKVGKFEDAKRIFRKMEGNGVVPNAYSYTVLIRGLCRGGRLDDCVGFCCEMVDVGHSPNAATFSSLVSGLCEEKGLEEAESVVRRLRGRGFAVDEKAVREHMEKNGPFSRKVWEAIFGKERSRRWSPFLPCG